MEKKIKESNPEALYSNNQNTFISNSIGSLKQSGIDLLSPRGDHAQDAFDQSLSDEIRDNFGIDD